jgi:DNA modification methylase
MEKGVFNRDKTVWIGVYGLEPTVEMYIAHSMEFLKEIKRVLRNDGVCFWNLGDSYNGSGGCHKEHHKNDAGFQGKLDPLKAGPGTNDDNLKPKDLCLIPERFAIAAQQQGWWVRSRIAWVKPNPMPESVRDRPTDSWEHIWMLTKSARYYWDIDAAREPSIDEESYTGRRPRNAGRMNKYDPNNYQFHGSIDDNGKLKSGQIYPTRNLRSVWEFPTAPYPEAHFATFPPELPKRCILAATKPGDIVLDPFTGSGYTLQVAAELGRKAVGYEISTEYCELIVKRNRQAVLI